MSSIQIKDLVVGYDHQPAASVGTFTVSKGEYVCIVGENGSGKTTFMDLELFKSCCNCCRGTAQRIS